ncbi:hypothetical protein RRG08_039621 [Elysia crispata]|uniref:Uncharacterized protein n=1 Tax=Elysia crispata TaxID=231223 RepID=A0AAE0YAN4_9GAST|nr:hypothetical protein RRG08_039621 [Elysia crispata]
MARPTRTSEYTGNTKVSKWLHRREIEEEGLETDYLNDDDCDYIPPCTESSSVSNISGIVPLQIYSTIYAVAEQVCGSL